MSGLLQNIVNQKLVVFAFDVTTNLPVTGDAANITGKISQDWGARNAFNVGNPDEQENGYYVFALTQAETNGHVLNVYPESSTPNVQVIGVPGTIYTSSPTAEYENRAIWIDTVAGNSGSVVGTNGTRSNPVDNLADAVLIATQTGMKRYQLLGASAITLISAHSNWSFFGSNGSSVTLGGVNTNGAHFECLTLIGDADGNDITARFCKLQSLTNVAVISFEFCLLIDNITLISGDHHFFQCASAVAGTSTPYIDLDGDGANARNLNLRGWLGGVEIRTHTSVDKTSFDCPAGQVVVHSSCTGGTIAMRGNINITDNAGGVVTFSENAAVNMSKFATFDTGQSSAVDGSVAKLSRFIVEAGVSITFTTTPTLYASRTDIEQLYGSDNVEKWADLNNNEDSDEITERINRSLTVATNDMNDILRGSRYSIPITDTGAAITLVDLCANLAGVWLYESRGVEDFDVETGRSFHRLAYMRDRAEKKLKAIAANRIRLNVPQSRIKGTAIPKVT